MAGASRITIRPLRPEDATALYPVISDPRVARTLLQLPSMEVGQTEQYLNRQDSNNHRLVAEVDGSPVGTITLEHIQRPRLNHMGTLGMYVRPDNWRQGVGTALMEAVLDLADNWLNLQRLQLDVFTHNEAAIRLYKKFGFESEGIRRGYAFGEGRYLDDMVMARLRITDETPVTQAGSTPALPPRKPPLEDLSVRPMHPDDVEALHDIFRAPEVGLGTLQLPSQERYATARRVEAFSPHRHRFVAESGGAVIGTISMTHSQRPRRLHAADMGMMVHPDYWGRGVGSALMEAVTDLADNWLNLQRLELDVFTDNPAAVRLYEKYDFVVEGTHRHFAYGGGRWRDAYFMARYGAALR